MHWASILPWAKDLARPLLPAKEYALPPAPAGSIVTPSAHYVPPGMRRPKFDAQGRRVEMRGEGAFGRTGGA